MGISSLCRIRLQTIYLLIMFRLIVVCALVACAAAIPAGPPAPYHPAPAPYHAPAPAYGKAPVYNEVPKPYAFEYGVADDYSGANFKAAETADGKVVMDPTKSTFPMV